jgi:hypothetical protein
MIVTLREGDGQLTCPNEQEDNCKDTCGEHEVDLDRKGSRTECFIRKSERGDGRDIARAIRVHAITQFRNRMLG